MSKEELLNTIQQLTSKIRVLEQENKKLSLLAIAWSDKYKTLERYGKRDSFAGYRK